MALLLFNVGVELGQLLFVLVVIFVEKILERVKIVWPSWVEAVPAYAVGSIGAFWAIQRTAVVLGIGG